MSRPTLENFFFREGRSSVGPGRSSAAVRFAVVLSLLPSETFHEGPPACEHGLVLLLVGMWCKLYMLFKMSAIVEGRLAFHFCFSNIYCGSSRRTKFTFNPVISFVTKSKTCKNQSSKNKWKEIPPTLSYYLSCIIWGCHYFSIACKPR